MRMTKSILNTSINGAVSTMNDRHILTKQPDVCQNNPYENVLYKTRPQGMAEEAGIGMQVWLTLP